MNKIFENIITTGAYELGNMLKTVDKYHIEGKLTDAQREDLHALARRFARQEHTVDLMHKLQELEQRIQTLEGTADAPADYTPGKWYYSGNTCIFGGKTYVCVAPQGTVCVWSPGEYPAYWEETL